MTRPATYALRLPQSLKAAAAKVAKRDGTSINSFITVAIAEKLSAMETVNFFAERSNRADKDAVKRLLTRSGGEPPCLGDEIPTNQ